MSAAPPLHLDPAAKPWGRWMQTQVEQLIQASKRGVQDDLNSNKGLNSSVGLLSGQIRELTEVVADLKGLVSVSATSPGGSITTPTTYEGAVIGEGPSVSLNLRRDASVQVSVEAQFEGDVYGTAAIPQTSVGASIFVWANGTYIMRSNVRRSDDDEITQGWTLRELQAPIYATRVMKLKAGGYTFSAPNPTLVLVGDTGNASLGTITISATVLNYTEGE